MEDSLQLNLHGKCEESLPPGVPEMEASMVSPGIRSGAPSTEAEQQQECIHCSSSERLVNKAACFLWKGQVQTDRSDRMEQLHIKSLEEPCLSLLSVVASS